MSDVNTNADILKNAATGNVQKVKSWSIGDTLKGFWGHPTEGGVGQDSSFLDGQVTIAGCTFKCISIPPGWIPWFRLLLLLGVKVGFVYSIIKLFMR